MYQQYLAKYAFRDQLIKKQPTSSLSMIVVIPAHDELSLLPTLQSLQKCELANGKVELIVVINASEKSEENIIKKNRNALKEAEEWYTNIENPVFDLHFIEENTLPHKHAGVGLARKIGMDEAVRRFDSIDNEEGVIVCFDADSRCESNYLKAIEEHFKKYTTGACSIHFEHPTEGEEYSQEIYRGIYYYELHLRYYKNALQYAGLPYAYHTIGSSMAVKAIAYCKQGGMNRRKAGEDFYFLQKFIDVGVLTELTTTTVIPSPRASHRVPFGTGRAIQEMIDEEREIEKSYAFECFEVVKESVKEVESWYTEEPNFNPLFVQFYGGDILQKRLQEIRKQSTNKERFLKRFFQWFNAFQALKFIHYLRDVHFPNQPLEAEVATLLEKMNHTKEGRNQLEVLREIDKDS